MLLRPSFVCGSSNKTQRVVDGVTYDLTYDLTYTG